MIRLADYVTTALEAFGVRHVFLITGGGAMHLNDAIGRSKGLEYICCHHEQALAMAAESYARLHNRIAVVNVTTGPGSINTLNGVFGAFTDSVPMLIISGQVKRETMLQTYELNGRLRQLGDQETDIISMVKGITKYAITVEDPLSIRYHLEKAFHLATSGRPGPCWIDVPIDVQGSVIDESGLYNFDPEKEGVLPYGQDQSWKTQLGAVLERMFSAKRPVIMAGTGVRLSGSADLFNELIPRWKMPVVTAFSAHDLVADDNPYYSGRPGTIGDRPGNFCVQNADALLVLGCRLNIRQVSYNWKSFASNAFKIQVDVDPFELNKPMVVPDMAVCADLKDFLKALIEMQVPEQQSDGRWLAWCQERRRRYPIVLPEYYQKTQPVNPYCFIDKLFQLLPENQIIVCANGTACITTFQGARLKKGQRLWSNSGSASMGYDLPAAIGACVADGRKEVICIAGDGSIQMNLQELETIVSNELPIKIFVMNNGGYHSIRQTQTNYFPDNIVGCGVESGLGFPDFEKLSHAYGLKYFRVSNHRELEPRLNEVLSEQGPVVCEVVLDRDQPFSPKLLSQKLPDGTMVSPSLENLWPFLSADELKENMSPP